MVLPRPRGTEQTKRRAHRYSFAPRALAYCRRAENSPEGFARDLPRYLKVSFGAAEEEIAPPLCASRCKSDKRRSRRARATP